MDVLQELLNVLKPDATVSVNLAEAEGPIPLSHTATTTAAQTVRCTVPLADDGTIQVELPADPQRMHQVLQGLIDLVCRLARTQQAKDAQVRALAEQMTYQLEELDYLRRLAVLLELSKQQPSTWAIACELAPVLHGLLLCESLALCRVDEQERPCEWHIQGADQPRTRLEQTLDRLRNDPQFHRTGGILMTNHGDALGKDLQVRSAIAVPITLASSTYGWLLALNSTCPEGFGTVEASLLRTTAQILGVHASNMILLEEQREFLFKMVQALVSAIDAKDPYTCGHSARVALIAKRIAEEMGLSPEECDQVYLAGLLHDVGKIGVADRILLKPGRLTDEEFEEIKKHPIVGYKILRHLKKLSFALPGVLYHHERMDGRGYPEGMRGQEIPLIARIIAVADSFDAMASNRPYRQGMPIERICQILREGAGQQWDRNVVDAFFRAFDDILELWSSNLEGYVSFEELSTTKTSPQEASTTS